ncbi:MAG: efflux RND transporter periplasmic adaptor subunit [Betaproteobacteria bacterium]|nr:efflux RND transporter periplasmic adaptor subunit [Betaproteobacteria bacterium]
MLLPRPPRWLVGVAALVAVALAVLAFRSLQGRAVDVVPATTTRLQQSVVVSGRVLAPAKVEIGATITGRIASVAVDDGDRVAAGQVVVVLESDELAAALAQAQSSVRAAESRIRQWRSVAAPNAREQLAQAEANARLAETEHARQSALFAQGFIGQARLDESRRSLSVAQSQLAAARSTAEANRDDGAERQILEDQLATARAARDAAAAKLAQTRIVAPAAGIVLVRTAEPGDIAQPGRTVMTLALDGATRLVAPIDEKNLAVLKPGQAARVSADAFPATRFDAVLDTLSPGIDVQRGTVEAKFRVPAPPPFLRSDMTVSIDIAVADKEGALVVPAAALREASSPEPSVLVLRDGVAARAGVRIGARTSSQVEILAGLAAGDLVITESTVAPGDRVRALTCRSSGSSRCASFARDGCRRR